MALFNVFNLTTPSTDVLDSIYTAIISRKYAQFNGEIKDIVSQITKCTLELYTYIIESMPATPAKFHYM